MAALYFDEDVRHGLAVALRNLGHDVLTAGEDGRAGQGIDDQFVLARATALSRAVVTKNAWDFVPLHQSGVYHTGIITVKDHLDDVAIAQCIDAAIAGRTDLTGLLIRVTRPAPS